MEKMKDMQAALFDLDGVIFDTEGQYTVFWGAQCREYHPEHPGLEHEIKGQTLEQIFDAWFAGPLAGCRPVVVERLNAYERQMSYDYVPGFVDYVSQLRRKGIATAVVTSSNQAKMAAVNDRHPEFRGLFDAILTAEDFARSKPDPDCYLKAARHFGIAPARCVVFEDSFNGLKAGRAAGMTVVGLSTTNTAESIRPLCDIVVRDFAAFGLIEGKVKSEKGLFGY